MNIQTLFYFVPILFALHNIEEAYWIKKQDQIILPFQPKIKPVQFIIAVFLLSIVVLFGTIWGVRHLQSEYGLLLIVGFQVIILVNSIFSHIFIWIRNQKYNPGLVSAFFINLPFSIILLHWVVNEGLITMANLIVLFAISLPAMLIFIIGSLIIGKLIHSGFEKLFSNSN